MMLVGIAQGFYPDEVLKLRYSDIIGGVTNPDLKRYIKEHLNFSQNSDPYILGKKIWWYLPHRFSPCAARNRRPQEARHGDYPAKS